jgi:MoaA/NifB/PqqE/SkfB family radical SAM enzyme
VDSNLKEIDIEVSRRCNLGCITCPRKKAPNVGYPFLTLSNFTAILDSLGPLESINFIGGGEPLLNPHLGGILREASNRGVKVRLTTNGTLVTPEIIDCWKDIGGLKIYVSLDSMEQSLLDILRPGASVRRVRESIRILCNSGINTKINFLIYRSNLHELMDFAQFCKDVGVSKLCILTPKYGKEDLGDEIWGRPLYGEVDKDYIGSVKAWMTKEGIRFSNSPFFLPTFFSNYFCREQPYITLEGNVFICLAAPFQGNILGIVEEYYHRNKTVVPTDNFLMGNIFKEDFSDIWQGPAYKEFRSFMDSTERPEGTVISIEELKEIRRNPKDSRFSYCEGCLIRWRQTCEV